MVLIQLSDWVYGLKHSEIMQTKIKQFPYEKPWLICVRVVMSTCFFVEEIIEAVSSIAKRCPNMKNEVDIWIKCLVNSILNKDMIFL